MTKNLIVLFSCLYSLSGFCLKYRCPYVGGEADNEILVDTHYKIACLSDQASCDIVELIQVKYIDSEQTLLVFSGETPNWGAIEIDFNLTKLSAEITQKIDQDIKSTLRANEACFKDPSVVLSN